MNVFELYLDMQDLIDEAKLRNVSIEDIFEPGDTTMDPKEFLKMIEDRTSSEYISNAYERVKVNSSSNLFYKTLLSFLDSLGTDVKNYTRIAPAEVVKDQAKNLLIPVDGRHRAVMCDLLGIQVPVKIREESVSRMNSVESLETHTPEVQKIGASLEETLQTQTVFRTDKTGVPYYDDIMRDKESQKYYNTKFEIVEMSPKEYFERCSEIFGNSFEAQVAQVSRDTVVNEHLTEVLKKGEKFPLAFLDYTQEKSQEGRHRMYVAALLYGWEELYPVVIFTNLDDEEAARRKVKKEQDRIYRYIDKAVNSALKYSYDTIDEVKEQIDWELQNYLDNYTLSIEERGSQLIITVNDVPYEIDKSEFIE